MRIKPLVVLVPVVAVVAVIVVAAALVAVVVVVAVVVPVAVSFAVPVFVVLVVARGRRRGGGGGGVGVGVGVGWVGVGVGVACCWSLLGVRTGVTAGTRVGSATVVVTGGAAGVGSGTAAGVTPGESTGGAGAGAGAGGGLRLRGRGRRRHLRRLWRALDGDGMGVHDRPKVGTARRTGARCVRTITAASWFAPPVFEEPVFEAPVFESRCVATGLRPGTAGCLSTTFTGFRRSSGGTAWTLPPCGCCERPRESCTLWSGASRRPGSTIMPPRSPRNNAPTAACVQESLMDSPVLTDYPCRAYRQRSRKL